MFNLWCERGISLYCKLNGKHVSEMLKNSREVSMIILVDIESIDYSWFLAAGYILNNRARESRFLYVLRFFKNVNLYFLPWNSPKP